MALATQPRRSKHIAIIAGASAMIVALAVQVPGAAAPTITSTQLAEDGSIPAASQFYTGDVDTGTGRVFFASGSSVATIYEYAGGIVDELYVFGVGDGYFYESAMSAANGRVYWAQMGNGFPNATIYSVDPNDVGAGKRVEANPGCGYVYALWVDATDLHFSCANDDSIRTHTIGDADTASSTIVTTPAMGDNIVDIVYRAADESYWYLVDRAATWDVYRHDDGVDTLMVTSTENDTTQVEGIDMGSDGRLFLARSASSGGNTVEVMTSEDPVTLATVHDLLGYTAAYAYGMDVVVDQGASATGGADVVGYFVAAAAPTANLFELTGDPDVDPWTAPTGGGGPVNQPPAASDDVVHTSADRSVVVAPLTGDEDPEGAELTLHTVGAPADGTVEVDGSSVTYAPPTGWTGTTSFEYEVSDGVRTDTGRVTIHVQSPGDVSDACPTVATVTFTDVAVAGVHQQAIGCAQAWGLMEGYPDGSFLPTSTVTRGEWAVVLSRIAIAAGLQDHGAEVDGTFASALSNLRGHGARNGLEPHNDMSWPMTRDDVSWPLLDVIVVTRGWRGAPVPDAFTDDDGLASESRLDVMSDLGIALGDTDGTYGPDAKVNRAEAAAMAVRLVDHLVELGGVLPLGSSTD